MAHFLCFTMCLRTTHGVCGLPSVSWLSSEPCLGTAHIQCAFFTSLWLHQSNFIFILEFINLCSSIYVLYVSRFSCRNAHLNLKIKILAHKSEAPNPTLVFLVRRAVCDASFYTFAFPSVKVFSEQRCQTRPVKSWRNRWYQWKQPCVL